MCVAFPLLSSSSWHHLGVPQFNSVLTLSAWRHCQIVSQVQGSVPPHFWCQRPVIGPQVTHSLGLTSVPRFSARSLRLSWPPPQVQLSCQSSSRTRGSSGLTSSLRGVMKDADTHTGDEEDGVRPGAGGGPECRSLCPCGVGVWGHPPPGVDVCTCLKLSRDFYGGAFMQTWSVINSVSGHAPLSGEQGQASGGGGR